MGCLKCQLEGAPGRGCHNQGRGLGHGGGQCHDLAKDMAKTGQGHGQAKGMAMARAKAKAMTMAIAKAMGTTKTISKRLSVPHTAIGNKFWYSADVPIRATNYSALNPIPYEVNIL